MKLIPLLAMITFTFHGEEITEKGSGMNTCTAVMINEQQLLTAFHCVERVTVSGKMVVEDNKGKSYPAHYITKNEDLDLAVIQIQDKHSYIKFGKMPLQGDKVITVNSGDSMKSTYNEGIVNNLWIDTEYHNVPMIIFSAAIQRGASGGGLFNTKGQLIGINLLSYQGLSEAVDINAIKKFLKKNHVYYREN